MSIGQTAARILAACEHLERSEPVEALHAINASDPAVAAQSIASVAHGLLCEHAGNEAAANEHFLRAFELGAHFSAVLRQCAHYFARVGDHNRAFQCMVLLDSYEPGTLVQFVRSLAPAALARYAAPAVRALRAAPRPMLGALRPIKQALVQQLGPEAAAIAYMQMTGNHPGTVRILSTQNLRTYAREHASYYDEISPASLIDVPALPRLGAEWRQPFQARSRTVFRCLLDDVIVSSKSNFLLAGDYALLDHEQEELDKVPVLLDIDPIVFALADGKVTIGIERGAVTAEPMQTAFTLVGVNSYNYWHWQVEFLPRLLACLDLPDFSHVPILVDEKMPVQSLQALRFCVGADHPVRVLQSGEAVRVGKLWTSSMFLYVPLWPDPAHAYAPQTFVMDSNAFARQFAKLAPALQAIEASGPHRIFMSRKGGQHRDMVNSAEVQAWFEARGFVMMDMGELGFLDQVRAMRAADVIVGPNGAALINSLFARPGTRIGVLDNPYDDNDTYSEVCNALNQKSVFMTGDVVEQDEGLIFNSSYMISVDLLPAFLEELLM